MKRLSPPAVLAALLCAGPSPAAPDGEDGITREAFLARQARLFDAWDRDRDGVLSPQEHAAMRDANPGDAQPARPARALLHPSK